MHIESAEEIYIFGSWAAHLPENRNSKIHLPILEKFQMINGLANMYSFAYIFKKCTLM